MTPRCKHCGSASRAATTNPGAERSDATELAWLQVQGVCSPFAQLSLGSRSRARPGSSSRAGRSPWLGVAAGGAPRSRDLGPGLRSSENGVMSLCGPGLGSQGDERWAATCCPEHPGGAWRGPNQPRYMTVGARERVPSSAIATGTIRTTVRLSSAYTPSCHVARSISGFMNSAPKKTNVTALSSVPRSCAGSGSAVLVCRPLAAPKTSPATNAAMKPLPPSGVAGPNATGSQHCVLRDGTQSEDTRRPNRGPRHAGGKGSHLAEFERLPVCTRAAR